MAKKTHSCIAPTRPAQSHSVPNLTVVFLGSQMLNRAKTVGSHYLLGINNHKALIDYEIEQCRLAFPMAEFLFVGGFEVDRIIKKRPRDLKIIENLRWEEYNQIEEIRLALNCITNNNVVFISHDSKFDHRAFNGMLAGSSTLEYHTPHSNDMVGVRSNGGYVECFSYHVDVKWPGIVYLCDKELELMRQYASVRDNGKQFMFEALNYILTKRNIRMVKNDSLIGRIVNIEDISSI